MSDEDRIQLMILVKEGKISVQEAVDTVHSPCIASLSCLACIFHTLTLTLNLTLTLTVLTPLPVNPSTPLLSYGYSYKASCDRPSVVIFDIRAFWRSALSVRVPECQKLQMTA